MKALPTKADLLQQDLVVIDDQHKSITTNTLKVSNYFGKQHKNVLRRITNLVKNSRLKIEPSKYIDERGKVQNYYILDRKNFSIVVLGFTGEQAEDFRIEYVEQFERNAAELIEWRTSRQDVLAPTKTCNDAIEWLRLELLKEIPESGKPKFLYINIQKSVTKAAAGNANTDRAVMTSEQLRIIGWLKIQVHDEIERMKTLGVSAVKIRESILELLKAR
ncbi:MAG: Rha family transcriptional regulator [Gammaproteobacteria bacterium]|nr:Rha family transcriptional regulator [Gammaproteobacteria bacterium]